MGAMCTIIVQCYPQVEPKMLILFWSLSSTTTTNLICAARRYCSNSAASPSPLSLWPDRFQKVEVGEPDGDAPDRGRVVVEVSCSNSLFPKFDERSSGDVNAVLSRALERSMRGAGGKPSKRSRCLSQ